MMLQHGTGRVTFFGLFLFSLSISISLFYLFLALRNTKDFAWNLDRETLTLVFGFFCFSPLFGGLAG